MSEMLGETPHVVDRPVRRDYIVAVNQQGERPLFDDALEQRRLRESPQLRSCEREPSRALPSEEAAQYIEGGAFTVWLAVTPELADFLLRAPHEISLLRVHEIDEPLIRICQRATRPRRVFRREDVRLAELEGPVQ
jgi:hypothetical protein